MREASMMVAVLSLVAAACGGGSTDTTSATTAPATSEAGATGEPGTTVSPPDPGDGGGVAEGWTLTRVAGGIKPVLALDGSDLPAIAWLVEETEGGFVSFAAATDGWAEDRFIEGYFYGPIGLDFDPAGNPNIVYHDHQATSFQDHLGDLTHAVRNDDGWAVAAATDDGHDGWDSTVVVGTDGVVRAAGIDPQQFGSRDGVEFYELGPSGWEITAIGTGPIEYEWNVSLAVTDADEVGLTYFDNTTTELVFAQPSNGTWSREVVDADGDAGRFSSLAFDAAGDPHISYYEAETGTVRYAVRRDGTWATEDVGTLADVEISFSGARRITAIDIDAAGAPHVAFTDRRSVRYASRSDDGWEVAEVLTASDRPLGQLVSLALDGNDTPHLATYEGTAADPLDAEIIYLTVAGLE